jgi:hypothetical protein
LTGREIRFRKTCKTVRDAQIELGKLLALAEDGWQPDSDVTLAQLLDATDEAAILSIQRGPQLLLAGVKVIRRFEDGRELPG